MVEVRYDDNSISREEEKKEQSALNVTVQLANEI